MGVEEEERMQPLNLSCVCVCAQLPPYQAYTFIYEFEECQDYMVGVEEDL